MTSWICAGKSLGEIASRQAFVRRSGVEALLRQTEAYHHLWVRSGRTDTGGLPAPVADLFTRSLLIIRSHVDNHGGIIASCDSDILRLSHDTYNYVWPRDGAFEARVLDAAGYHDITRKFYSFCRDSLTGEGFLMQKYNPDGSWGSTSHSSVGVRGEEQLPIQEDETALVLFTLWQHYAHAGDTEFVLSLYEPLICRAADFLVRYRDEQTDLPHPSYDLWEENFGIFTFTASAVYGGLVAAAQFAGIFGETDRAERYARAASEIRDDILRHLWDPEAGRFVKSIRPTESGNYVRDLTVDASAFGICEFGVLPAGHEYVARTMTSVESALWVKTKIGGCARYEKDNYQRVGDDYAAVPGNPWPVCTLWLARWHIATGDMVRGMELLSWTLNRASQAGHLAEQLDPYHGIPLSVSPLTWSHAAFAETVIRYREKMRGLTTPQKGFDGNTGVPPVSPGMTNVVS